MPAAALNRHYSLPAELAGRQPLAGQLARLHEWATALVQLDRQGAGVVERTWRNQARSLLLLLGFAHVHMRRRGECSLQWLLDADLLAAFFSFQLHKGNSCNTMLQHIAAFKKALAWLRGTAAAGAAADRVADWLARLGHQLQTAAPRRVADVGELQQQGRWAAASELVMLLERLRVRALAAVPPTGSCLPWAARLLHDAALGNIMFGYMPPMRSFIIRSLAAPSPNPRCLDPDCGAAGACRGNRLAVDPATGHLCMVLVHYKNQKRQASPLSLLTNFQT